MTSGSKASHTSIHSLIHVPCLQHEIRAYCKRRTLLKLGNEATGWSAFYSSAIQLSPLSGWPRQARVKQRCRSIRDWLAANFVSGMGPCTGIVQPFKHLLRATAHPQFLMLELRVPMGTCPGQYGNLNSQS